MRLRPVVVAWDFVGAVASAAIVAVVTPHWIVNTAAQDLFRVATSVLSLLFSVFFAALAVIISAANEEFLVWLESERRDHEESDYQKVVGAYKLSLVALFVALIIALWLFAYTTVRISIRVPYQRNWFLVAFTFFFFYGLFVALQSSFYAVRFSQFRNEFAVLRKQQTLSK